MQQYFRKPEIQLTHDKISRVFLMQILEITINTCSKVTNLKTLNNACKNCGLKMKKFSIQMLSEMGRKERQNEHAS